ncbi:hypothetical protein [Lysobacter changpingensis]|uniref:hypothetical protein n=1 Tax=Lysobacter changpingensis TaxID=2792784 RepID=UPI001A904897|nr:hypothetical protein [Lysobacter changpingensis]
MKQLTDKHKGDTRSGVGRQPERDELGRRPTELEEASSQEEGLTRVESVPSGGMNPEVGELDADADAERDPAAQDDQDDGGDNSLPGKMGGGLMGA